VAFLQHATVILLTRCYDFRRILETNSIHLYSLACFQLF